MTFEYMTGFGNEHSTEAETGALPVGRNSPQRAPLGLYAEKFSATAFTAPKASNARSWLYRIRPSVVHHGFKAIQHQLLQTAPLDTLPTPPDALRWDPFPLPDGKRDFIDSLMTLAACGDATAQQGAGIHIYCANTSMHDRYFYTCDGELLIVPQQGELVLHTEFGVLAVPPESVAVIPRGVKFRVMLTGKEARGYVCENYGSILELPERGPIGSDGLANARDFEYPVARYDDKTSSMELVCKLNGALFATTIDASPLDVVGWHGNVAPYRYDLNRFNVMGSISYDHPDPSIFTVLTSQTDTPGTANLDFVAFAPRWLVMTDTFRPPWYHRNIMSEFMGLITGEYDAKTGGGFVPGGSSLHNCMVPHGPDADAFKTASEMDLKPQHLDNTLAFMFESRYLIRPSKAALQSKQLQSDYADAWSGLQRHFHP